MDSSGVPALPEPPPFNVADIPVMQNPGQATIPTAETEIKCASAAEKLKSLLESEPEGQTRAPRFKLVMADDMEFALTNNYLIKGIIDRDAVSCIYGSPGSAKTWWTALVRLYVTGPPNLNVPGAGSSTARTRTLDRPGR